eukprot:304336-Chlamydomonas_euryale.AAC.1
MDMTGMHMHGHHLGASCMAWLHGSLPPRTAHTAQCADCILLTAYCSRTPPARCQSSNESICPLMLSASVSLSAPSLSLPPISFLWKSSLPT